MKRKLLICTFSGGRTSAFMAYFISRLPKYRDNYEIIFIFCNTGKERPETLQFIKDCQDNWGINIVWLEAKVHEGRVGTTFQLVDFESASRNGEPFEEMLKKYPMPNNFASNCTRELKMRPIEKYVKTLGYSKWVTAMGIRKDEEHRRSNNAIKDSVIYPLMDDIQVDSKFIRSWWDKQTFDLKLKDYEGNCDLCFKKSTRKKLTIIKEDNKVADWWRDMEVKYSSEKIPRFDLRTNLSVNDLIKMSDDPFRMVRDLHELNGLEYKMDLGMDLDIDFETDCFCKAN